MLATQAVSLLSTADGAVGLLLQAAVTEITGHIITSGGSDHTKQLARAEAILAIAQANQAIRNGQTKNDHVVVAYSERTYHLRVVAGCTHRRAQVGLEENVHYATRQHDEANCGQENG